MSYRDAVMAAKYAGGSNEQATALHEERLDPVAAGDGYFGFDEQRAVVVHVVPDGVYDDGYALDLGASAVVPEADPSRPTQLPVLGARDPGQGTWTADGFGAAVATDADPDRCAGYAHLFSNGVVESVSALPFADPEGDDENPLLDGRALELDLTAAVRRYLRLLAYHQATAPVHVAISVFGTAGCRLDPGPDGPDAAPIREDLFAPFPVTLSNFDADVRSALADPLDALWRSAGYPGSPFVDDGGWTLRSAYDGR